MTIERYLDLKRDLMTAFSLLEPHLTVGEAWELYAAIDLDGFDEALRRLRELAEERGASDATDVLLGVVLALGADPQAPRD